MLRRCGARCSEGFAESNAASVERGGVIFLTCSMQVYRFQVEKSQVSGNPPAKSVQFHTPANVLSGLKYARVVPFSGDPVVGVSV